MLKPVYYLAIAAVFSLVACKKSEEVVVSNDAPANTQNLPQASFFFPSATYTAPCDIAFSNTTAGANTTYLWDFGDGTTSTAATPRHRYSAGGVYTVRLTATNSNGTNVTTRTVNVASYTTCGVLNVIIYSLPVDLPSFSHISYTVTNSAGQNLGFSSSVDPSTTYYPSNLPVVINQNGSSFRETTDLNSDLMIKITFYDNTGAQVTKDIALKPRNFYPRTPGARGSVAAVTFPGGWLLNVEFKWA